VQERAGADQKRIWAGLRQAIERLPNLAFVDCLESLDRQPENSCRRFDIGLEPFGRLEIEVDEGRDGLRMRKQLVQKSEPLGCQCAGYYCHPSGISAGTVQTCDETESPWTVPSHEGERNRTCCRLRRRNRRAIREDHGHTTADQVGGK